MLVGAFAIGYVTMSRHVDNAGAFRTYIAKGLGGATGTGAGAVAVVSCLMILAGRPAGARPAHRHPRPSLSLLIISALFAASTWAITEAAGPGGVVAADRHSTRLLFVLAAERLPVALVDLATPST